MKLAFSPRLLLDKKLSIGRLFVKSLVLLNFLLLIFVALLCFKWSLLVLSRSLFVKTGRVLVSFLYILIYTYFGSF